MRIKSVSLIIVFVFACIAMSAVSGFCAVDRSTGSALSNDLLKVRYNLVNADIHEAPVFELSDDFAAEDPSGSKSGSGYKSPAKAFILSLAVPGLGQYYYGSKIKPLVFLGVEVTSWVLYFKWNSEGDDITAEFEAFNRRLHDRLAAEAAAGRAPAPPFLSRALSRRRSVTTLRPSAGCSATAPLLRKSRLPTLTRPGPGRPS